MGADTPTAATYPAWLNTGPHECFSVRQSPSPIGIYGPKNSVSVDLTEFQNIGPCRSHTNIVRPPIHPPSISVNETTNVYKSNDTTSTGEGETTARPRYPLSLSTMYLKPLRREAQYGVPTCDLQLRSYTPRNLEFFCDFALRAAYYLDLPAFGPVPLPRITERWTVPKSSFIFKKSQENFERVTVRRLIQIRDGHPESVQIWLAFLRKHAYYGIGMKANVWEFSNLGAFAPSVSSESLLRLCICFSNVLRQVLGKLWMRAWRISAS